MKAFLSLSLGLVLLSRLSMAGGIPSRLNAEEATLPRSLDKGQRVLLKEKKDLLPFLQGSYAELQDRDCIQKMLKTPGHLARKALGYNISGILLTKSDKNLVLHVEYLLPDGTDGVGEGSEVSNGYPSVVHECALANQKDVFPDLYKLF